MVRSFPFAIPKEGPTAIVLGEQFDAVRDYFQLPGTMPLHIKVSDAMAITNWSRVTVIRHIYKKSFEATRLQTSQKRGAWRVKTTSFLAYLSQSIESVQNVGA